MAAKTVVMLINADTFADIAPAVAQIISWGADGGIIGSVWGSGAG